MNADEHYRQRWTEQLRHSAKLAMALNFAISRYPDLINDEYIAAVVAADRERLGLPRT